MAIQEIGWFVIAVFLCGMVWLARKEYKSVEESTFLDYKSTIVSLGILGTFIGIFLGLWNFDPNKIQTSVPALLEGLKVAFVTSIAGMGIAVCLTIIERQKHGGATDDETELLKNISQTLNNISQSQRREWPEVDLLQNIRETTNKIQEMQGESSEALITQIKLFRQESHDAHSGTITLLTEQFSQTNQSLGQAIEALSRGATEEIIKALEAVIQDFNRNLTEQFGENFKQLNEACLQLVQWQQGYRDVLMESHEKLTSLFNALEVIRQIQEQIGQRNEQVIAVHEQLKDIIETFSNQANGLSALLERYADLGGQAQGMFEAVQTGVTGTTDRLKEFSETMQQTFMEQSKAMARQLGDFSQEMQRTVGAQSQTLSQLTERQLPGALKQLEDSLVALTEKFAENYREFLDRSKEISSSK